MFRVQVRGSVREQRPTGRGVGEQWPTRRGQGRNLVQVVDSQVVLENQYNKFLLTDNLSLHGLYDLL